MRGVDVFAQRQSYSNIGRRSRKCFYSLAGFLVDITVHNAYILHRRTHNHEHSDEKAFRKELARLLVGMFSSRRKEAAAPKRPRDSLHRLVHGTKRGACVQCHARVGAGGHNRRSHYACADCSVFFCVPDCDNRHIQALAHYSIESADE